jgi:hypothetical protein
MSYFVWIHRFTKFSNIYNYTITVQAYFSTSPSVGPMGSSEAARLHWWNARTWSGWNTPTTVWRTPRLWKMTRSFSRLLGNKNEDL